MGYERNLNYLLIDRYVFLQCYKLNKIKYILENWIIEFYYFQIKICVMEFSNDVKSIIRVMIQQRICIGN